MKKQIAGAIILVASMVSLLSACNPFAHRSGSGAPVSFSRMSRHVVKKTLANGLEVVVVPSKIAPVATSVLAYKVGALDASTANQSVAHAVQHMVMSGGTGLSAGELARVAQALGGNLSAATTESQTRYVFTVPARDLDTALHLQVVGMEGLS